MQNKKFRTGLNFLMAALSALILNGCYTQEELDAINGIINTSEDEVQECEYLGRPWTLGNFSLNEARFELKRKVTELGGTHLVETHAYPYDTVNDDIGIGLAGDAYKCPLEKGPKKSSLQSMLTEEDIFPPMPVRRLRHYEDCDLFLMRHRAD